MKTEGERVRARIQLTTSWFHNPLSRASVVLPRR